MKIFCLYYDESTVPIAICKDKWLLELFIAQRKLKVNRCRIKKDKKDHFLYNDRYILYYYGYAITNLEARYVEMNYMEAESDLDVRIHDVEVLIRQYQNILKPKRIKQLKKLLKEMKKVDLRESKQFAKRMIDDIIDRPKVVTEYLEALDMFKQCVDHMYLQ